VQQPTLPKLLLRDTRALWMRLTWILCMQRWR
jgi:hypothetical protein